MTQFKNLTFERQDQYLLSENKKITLMHLSASILMDIFLPRFVARPTQTGKNVDKIDPNDLASWKEQKDKWKQTLTREY